MVPIFCGLSEKNLSQIIHQRFGHILITRIRQMARKGLMICILRNIPDVYELWTICLSNKETKMTRGMIIDVSKFAPGFMLEINFSFFNVESTYGFTSNFVAICSVISHPFGFPYRSKRPHIDILKLLKAK